jgi:hypothetical protein
MLSVSPCEVVGAALFVAASPEQLASIPLAVATPCKGPAGRHACFAVHATPCEMASHSHVCQCRVCTWGGSVCALATPWLASLPHRATDACWACVALSSVACSALEKRWVQQARLSMCMCTFGPARAVCCLGTCSAPAKHPAKLFSACTAEHVDGARASCKAESSVNTMKVSNMVQSVRMLPVPWVARVTVKARGESQPQSYHHMPAQSFTRLSCLGASELQSQGKALRVHALV